MSLYPDHIHVLSYQFLVARCIGRLVQGVYYCVLFFCVFKCCDFSEPQPFDLPSDDPACKHLHRVKGRFILCRAKNVFLNLRKNTIFILTSWKGTNMECNQTILNFYLTLKSCGISFSSPVISR